ncbi:pentatricopeptide repeat domain-containing protein (PPR motif) [Caloramator fervidus]|uniref:Pentatricopeptide repeat domain-containing protein (PPR motif) n=1 Tax=Caloramator fervidus TaxID=29344 RepID=A0A1H5WNL6_9CLOT|nr:tetratricopeptide repeat protein [Caloramator fervidus]SEG00941.1 pentatricopeptide repeat domain-containing protein (PPR motif) [Caloramator fervidus]
MIDFYSEIQGIKPINIKDLQLKYKANDDVIKSIILYNKAIAEIKANNVEEAIKDLKKSLSFNKGFPEATKLLGLCYIYNKEYRKARKLFKSMIKNGIYKDIANKYLNVLGNQPKVNVKKVVVVLSIITLCFGVSYGFILISKTMNKPYVKVANSDKVNDLKKDKEKIYSQLNNAKEELDKTKSELEYYKSKYEILLKLNEIEQYYKDGDYEKAASSLVEMKNIKLDKELKLKFNRLYSDIRLKGLWIIYNEGNKLYKKGKYKEALPKLKLAYELGADNDIMPWLTYQIGKCYKEIKDDSNALIFFKKVVDNYPNSRYAYNCKKLIEQMMSKNR